MKFIFWQNVISIHQSAFIKALATHHDVTFVAENTLDQQRIKEKWIVPDMGKAKVIVAPDSSQMLSLLQSQDTQHIFSGIDAYPMVYQAFQKAVKLNVPISVMAEPYEWAGFKGLLRRLKYMSLYFRYGKNINHLFTTGNMGIKCYRKVGVPIKKLHQWGYFTEQNNTVLDPNCKKSKPAIIFIGKIDARKNILQLVDVSKKLTDKFSKFLIIGTGPYQSELSDLIASEPKIEYLGPIPNREIASYIVNSDLLVLPSLFDGWGAVVNEALAVGTRVLCSDRCGAEVLLDGSERGGTFNINSPNDLSERLNYWLDKGTISYKQRYEISQWAIKNINGTSASSYFCDVMSGKNKQAPWID